MRNHEALNRLICAAVVSKDFRHKLLEAPLEAVSNGYMGQNFALTAEEVRMLCSIEASDFQSFSQQVCDWISTNGDKGNGHGHAEYNQHEEEMLAPIGVLWLPVAELA